MTKQEMEERLKDIEERLDVLKEAVNKVEEEEWIPKEGENYYYYDYINGKLDYAYWDNDEIDNARLNSGVVFKTEEEAKEYKEYYLAKKKAINEFSREEWGENIDKYYCCIDNYDKQIKFRINSNFQYFNLPYFRSKQDTLNFAKKYKKFICKELGYKEDEITIEGE